MVRCPRGDAVDRHLRIGPVRTPCTVASGVVAHDSPPFSRDEVAMTIRRIVSRIFFPIMTRTKEMTDFMSKGVITGGTRVMNQAEGRIGVCPDDSGQSAVLIVINDEYTNIGITLFASEMDFVHKTIRPALKAFQIEIE